MKNFLKIFWASVFAMSLFWLIPMHIMMYLEQHPVEIPDVDFGDEIPDDYYDRECPIDYLRLGGDAEEWLDGLRWNRPYVPNEWDCSAQSAFVEWALESCGTEADILVGKSHAWVMVKMDGEWRQYEPTFGAFLSEGMESLIDAYWRFDDLPRLRRFFKNRWERYPNRWVSTHPDETFDEWFASEWHWWEIAEEGDE